MNHSSEDQEIRTASTRSAGIAALRQIRKLVDEENAHDQKKTLWARRVTAIASAIIGLLLLAFLLKKF
ncbi:MAG: hypothetical protein BWY57_00699 [Betaproteobacteria bacterium ADurb.Bin341]|nr:MAG: hypothetical protein BWY57_00699 [Betaproteobacteria bacterium ADurb.Bin341]